MSAPSPLATPLPWDLVAPCYALEVVPTFEHFSRDALRLAGLEPGARVLDVACGPGTLSLLAAERASRVVAVDFSPKMIGRLEARLAELRVANVEPRLGDGQALDLPDGSFDRAFSMFGVIFFPDRARGLRELRRVLAPGGAAAISSWTPLRNVPLLAALFETLREKLPELPMGDPHPPLGTEEEVRAELEAAGFTRVEVHAVAHAFEAPDAAAFAASMRRTLAPLVLVRERMGEEAFRPVAEALDARLAALAGPGPVRVPMPAWIGVGHA